MSESYLMDERERAIRNVEKLLRKIKIAKIKIEEYENKIKRLSKEYGLHVNFDDYTLEITD